MITARPASELTAQDFDVSLKTVLELPPEDVPASHPPVIVILLPPENVIGIYFIPPVMDAAAVMAMQLSLAWVMTLPDRENGISGLPRSRHHHN